MQADDTGVFRRILIEDEKELEEFETF